MTKKRINKDNTYIQIKKILLKILLNYFHKYIIIFLTTYILIYFLNAFLSIKIFFLLDTFQMSLMIYFPYTILFN